MARKRLPPLVIQGLSVRDYAYIWIEGGCPLHQWCSGARGIDGTVTQHIITLRETVKNRPDLFEAADYNGLTWLYRYLMLNFGHPAEKYIPDEWTTAGEPVH